MVAKQWARQDDFDSIVYAAAARWRVEPALIKAVIATESGFNPRAYNPNDPGGAWGLMQVIEGTARFLGHRGPMSDLFDPAVGVDLGTRYLSVQQGRYPNVADTVAAYNAGSVRLRGDQRYVNQSYVDRVTGFLAYFRDYERGKGGATGGVAPFPGADGAVPDTLPSPDPGGPRGLVGGSEPPVGPPEPPEPPEGPERVPEGPEPPEGPERALEPPEPSPERPECPECPERWKVPVAGVVLGLGMWLVAYLGFCTGG